jgi:tetratricopeptide (TPR) repeat protein
VTPSLAIAIAALLVLPPQDELDRARRLIDERKAAEAVEILRPLTAPDSKNGPAFLALGDALRQLRKFGEALAAYRRAEELNPDSTPAAAGQAMMHARLRQFPDSEAKYRRVLEKDPASVEARVGLAWVLSLQRKLDEALAEVEKALALKPDHTDARIRLGWIRLWRHERDAAVAAFEQVLSKHPGDVEAALGLAAAELAQGRSYKAGELLEALGRLHPENVDVLMALARAQARRGMTYSSGQTAKRVVELERNHVEALLLQGELAIRDGRFTEGEAFYRRALELEPEDIGARTGIATALRRQGRREEAKAVYRSVLEKDPDHANARIGLGWELTWEGDYEAASAEFDRVLARDPKNTDALAGLARVRHLQGRWSESQELYERALATDPWDDAALEGHAVVRRARESRVRLSFLHAEEFERDQELELDTLQLVTNVLTATWRKRLSPDTAIDVEARLALTREFNRVTSDDNYDINHLALLVGARHRLADHWTVAGKIGFGEFENHDSRGTWRFPSGESFVEGSTSVSYDWSDHALSLSWSRSPLVIKDFPSTDLDVLSLSGFALHYESAWWKDGLTPEWHENQVEATLGRTSYSDDNSKIGLDATFRHRWLYDSGWRLGPLVRFRYADFDEDVAFYYSFDRQTRLTAGLQVEYEPPGAWSFFARYQGTHTVTKERVNPGSHLFDPTLPIDTREATVTVDGSAIDARVTWLASDSLKAGADGVYSWDNDHYITWAIGLYVEVGF